MLKEITLGAFDSAFTQPLAKNMNVNFGKMFFVPDSKPITQPYWLENKMEEGYFNVKDQQKIGQADVDPAYVANITINIEGQDFNFAKAVKYKFTDPVRGELYQPLVIVPTVTAKPQTTLILKKNKESIPVDVSLFSFKQQGFQDQRLVSQIASPDEKQLWAALPGIKKNQQVTSTVLIDSNYKNGEVSFNVNYPKDHLNEKHEIRYDHIPYLNYFSPAIVKVETIDVKIHRQKDRLYHWRR
jgi:hypothetical protein